MRGARASWLCWSLALLSCLHLVVSAIFAAESPEITGRVLNPDSTPAAQASVTLEYFDGKNYHDGGTATADAQGHFHIARPEALGKGDPAKLRNQFYTLYARAPGGAVTVHQILHADGDIDIPLARPVNLKFQVTNPAGKPLPGVAVRVQYMLGPNPQQFFEASPLDHTRLAAVTDADGRATIHDLPAGWQVELRFADQQFAAPSPAAAVRWISLGDQAEHGVEEPYIAVPAATVSGHLRHEGTDAPAPHLRVNAEDPRHGLIGWTDADADGRFEINGLPPGKYDLEIELSEITEDWTADTKHADPVGAGERIDGQDIKLIKGALITGRVTSAETGKGVPEMTISVEPKDTRSFWMRVSTTDAEGRYNLRVPAGSKHVSLGGLFPEAFSGPDKDSEDPTVADGETATVNFKLHPVAATDFVSGQVIDHAGRPVAKAHVLAMPMYGSLGRNREILSGDDGRFRIKLPMPDRSSDKTAINAVRLLARHLQSGATTQPVEVKGGQSATLTLDPAGLASIEGKVTDPTGSPIGHAEVGIFTDVRVFFNDDQRQIETDAAGHFRTADLWPGAAIRLTAVAKGFGHTSVAGVSLKPGETRTLDDLTLEVADKTIDGKVIDENGRPVAGIVVEASATASDSRATTDPQGHFHLKELTDEWCTLSVIEEDQRFGDLLRAKAGSSDVVLEKPKHADAPDGSGPRRTLITASIGQRAPSPEIEPGSWIKESPSDDLASALKGKVIILDFWGLECGACLLELPNIEAFYEKKKADGLIVLSIGDRRYSVEEVREFLDKRKEPPLTYLMARDGSGGKTTAAYGVDSYPSYAVIDRDGLLAYIGHNWAEASAKATELLGAGKP